MKKPRQVSDEERARLEAAQKADPDIVELEAAFDDQGNPRIGGSLEELVAKAKAADPAFEAALKAAEHPSARARVCSTCSSAQEDLHPAEPCLQCKTPITYVSCAPGYCRTCAHDPSWREAFANGPRKGPKKAGDK